MSDPVSDYAEWSNLEMLRHEAEQHAVEVARLREALGQAADSFHWLAHEAPDTASLRWNAIHARNAARFALGRGSVLPVTDKEKPR